MGASAFPEHLVAVQLGLAPTLMLFLVIVGNAAVPHRDAVAVARVIATVQHAFQRMRFCGHGSLMDVHISAKSKGTVKGTVKPS